MFMWPLVAGSRQPPADDVGEILAEITAFGVALRAECPLPDRLMADLDVPEREHLSSTIRRLNGKRKYSQTV